MSKMSALIHHHHHQGPNHTLSSQHHSLPTSCDKSLLYDHPSGRIKGKPFTEISPQKQNIITPPTSYLSTSTTTISAASQHYFHQQQNIHYHNLRNSKRKSAVELLAESKPFYVKSETVLDRQQQLNIRGASLVNVGNIESPYLLSPSRTLSPQNQPQIQQKPSRRSTSSGSDLLQTKLRKLLNTGDSKETIITSETLINSKYNTIDSSYIIKNSLGYIHPPKNYQQLTVHPEQQSDVSVFFPSAFLSPQSLPPHPVGDDDLYLYGIHDSLVLTDDYRTISPPAEYAENSSPEKNAASHRYNYQRSYSHSQAVATGHHDETDYPPSPSYNINSHKSLPDLHSQISRHSPHSEALSCCSRGNRSNRSGSSFNRDSGGSSGHYTHHSEPPCCKQQQQQQQQNDSLLMSADYRRDSGSSTQHSGNSYYAYGIPPMRYDCIECRAKIRDGADCLLNFTTPEVPEAFQDTYTDKPKQKYYDDRSLARKYYSKNTQGPLSPLSPMSPLSPQDQQLELSPPLGTFKRQKCLRFKNRGRQSAASNPNSRCNSGNSANSGGDLDDRRPILRSKSDISDRYWNRVNERERDREKEQQQKLMDKQRPKSDSLSQLEHFFDHLGLNDDKYEQFIAPLKSELKSPSTSSYKNSKSERLTDEESDTSAVFFSDVSTIDSTRLPDSTDNSQQQQERQNQALNQLNNPAMYRPSEPPSIIERNARIIKWLCNCRKMQLA